MCSVYLYWFVLLVRSTCFTRYPSTNNCWVLQACRIAQIANTSKGVFHHLQSSTKFSILTKRFEQYLIPSVKLFCLCVFLMVRSVYPTDLHLNCQRPNLGWATSSPLLPTRPTNPFRPYHRGSIRSTDLCKPYHKGVFVIAFTYIYILSQILSSTLIH